MKRRNFMTALFGTGAVMGVGIAVPTEVKSNSGLTTEEQAMMDELKREGMIRIPSRKSFLSTDETRRKGRILKRLAHLDKVHIDYFIANGYDEHNATCLVYWLPAEGRKPSDTYK